MRNHKALNQTRDRKVRQLNHTGARHDHDAGDLIKNCTSVRAKEV